MTFFDKENIKIYVESNKWTRILKKILLSVYFLSTPVKDGQVYLLAFIYEHWLWCKLCYL